MTNNTITIQEITTVDVTSPTVIFTDPASGKKDVPIGTEVTALFSEKINVSTVATSTFILKDITGKSIFGTVSASGETATFTPSKELDYETKYAARLTTEIKDAAGNPIDRDYTWEFTTIPSIPEPIAANNRILPGSTDPVKIYIPEPPGGSSEKITVQVYTAKGQRVATLVDNRPYSQIVNDLPLLWYGKNGRQKDLGPGLYFIQIRTGSYKRVLKVLIVR